MECNKEEAVRAKQLAVKKMEIKDFPGALKIAVKAQQLYPELENISQLIVVCEVHCSAEKKQYGNEKDWYGILKVEPSADDVSIKKQYRKLALILHPDKNQFAGSTDAFKLIGEAQRVLLDRDKRLIHDSKRRGHGNFSAPSWIPKQPNRQPNVQQQHQQQQQHQHPWNQGRPANFTGGHSGNFTSTQQRFPNVGAQQATFWTVCPFCAVRYQFYRDDAVNRVIQCQNCKKPFTAFELNVSAAKAHAQRRKVPFTPKPAEGGKRNFTAEPVFEKKETPAAKGNVSRKRKKRMDESSESSDSSESSESDEENVELHSGSEGNGVQKKADKNPSFSDFENFGEPPRRSSRAKRNVSYKENTNDVDIDNDNDVDGDDVTPSNPAEKQPDKGDAFWKEEVTKVAESSDKKSQKEDDKRNSDNKGGESENGVDAEEVEPEVLECPEADFNDFEESRKEESFSAGQIWACYDKDDAMPRYYAYIKKVSPGFKLQIHWLKPDTVTADEKKWLRLDLPISCGEFRLSKLDTIEDLISFSHLVTWEASQKPKYFKIIPRKSETWALFKNWSMNWLSSDSKKRKYEYEFVEILSDFDEESGARVLRLEKVKGFVCLFKQKKGGEMVISGSEKYRFAHMVPSFRMSGEEEGVPKGSFELDPAALPESAFE